MKEQRYHSMNAVPAGGRSRRQDRLTRARRASLRVLCLAAALWATAAVGHLIFAAILRAPA